MRYFYSDSKNQPIGPYELDELKQLHLTGTIRTETWVIEEGGSQWQPYSNLASTGASLSNAIPPQVGPPTNDKACSPTNAIIWFLCCMPIGFMQWGQTAKGWVWLLATIVTGGVAGLPAIVDYWMNFSIQQNRKVGEWEFFPTR
jgi:hypothetical protein